MEAKAAPLLGAAEKGDLTVLRRCLRIGNPLHSHDRKGDTALHIAVRYNHIPAVRFLFGKGRRSTQPIFSPRHRSMWRQVVDTMTRFSASSR
jgi:ankyrin repeat protein